MKNFINHITKEDQSLTLNAIILLFAIILFSFCLIFYLIGLFANPNLENFFANIASIFFLGANGFVIIYLIKVTIELLIISIND